MSRPRPSLLRISPHRHRHHRHRCCRRRHHCHHHPEDWEGGAGNALGTFYAYEKACRLAAAKGPAYVPDGAKSSTSYVTLLTEETSVGIYHTAGKGTRLAPLPGAENNNKPGVKLPGMVSIGLEARNRP